MNNIKALILDIDGTISGESNQVTPEVKTAIQQVQSQGIKVGLATGRMYQSALRFHREIQGNLPIIAYNGAWMQDVSTGELLFHQPVNSKTAQDLLSYFREVQKSNYLEIHLYFNDQLYVEEVTDKTNSYLDRSGISVNVVGKLENLLHDNPTKILALSPNTDLITSLLIDLKNRYRRDELYLTQSNPVYLEATQAHVNKGATVKYLAEKILGLTPEEVMTIGDNFNDSTMLEYAGFSVAMGDAPAPVKAIASAVTDTVENNGVASAIAQYFSINIEV